MTYDEWLKFAARDRGSNPTMYRPDALAKVLGYTGQAQTMTGMGGSPSESTGQGTEAQYALTPEFEKYLQQFSYQPGMQGKNPDVAIRDAAGNLVSDHFRTGDHMGSAMKAAGVIIPALTMAGFGAGAYGLMGGGGAAAGAGDAWGATIANSLDGMGVANVGAAAGEAGTVGGGLTAGGASGAGITGNSAWMGAGGAGLGSGTGIVAPTIAQGAGIASGLGTVAQGIGTGAKAMADLGWGDWAKIGAQLGSTLLQSNAVGRASDTQAAATAAASAEQRRQFDLTRNDYAPYRDAGVRSLGTLEGELSRMPTAAEVMAQPGYQFGMQQGQQAIDRKTAAGGGRVSGAALKGAAQYATDYATTGYNAEYQRRQDRLARLQTLSGLGQSATSGTAAAGQNSTNNLTALTTAQGNATGAGQLAQGNIWGNALNSLGATAGRWAQAPTATTPG